MRTLATLAVVVMTSIGFGALLMPDAHAASCVAAPSTETTAPPPPVVVEGTFLGSEIRHIEYPGPGLREGDEPVPAISQEEDEIFRFRIDYTTSPLLEVGGLADVRMSVNRRYITEDGTQMQSHTPGGFSRPPVEGYRYRVVADWLQGFEGELLLATKSCGARGRLIALDYVPRQPPTTMPGGRTSAPGDGDGRAVGSAEAATVSTTTDGGAGLPAAFVATAVLLLPLVGYATWATRRQ